MQALWLLLAWSAWAANPPTSVCDVMGHGVRSALVTAMMRALVEELRALAADPGQLLTRLNRAKYFGGAGDADYFLNEGFNCYGIFRLRTEIPGTREFVSIPAECTAKLQVPIQRCKNMLPRAH